MIDRHVQQISSTRKPAMQKSAQPESRTSISLQEEAICSREKKASAFYEAVSQQTDAPTVVKKKGMYDKRTSLTEAVKRCLKDGISISIGGFTNTRIPVASIHEIIRQGARELTLLAQSNSICCELLAGAMILNSDHLSLRRLELAWHGKEIFSTAPLLGFLINNSMVQLEEYTSCGMSARFKAGAMGVPFLPITDHGGSDMQLNNRGRMIVCPFTGENIYLVPACRPDLALIHVQASDMYGNSLIWGDECCCPEIAQASVNSIVTAEQIVHGTNIPHSPNLTEIPFHFVGAIVDQPFGATPGACYGNYGCDRVGIQEFTDISEDFCKTGNKEKLRAYYNKYIFDVENFDDFLEQKPYPILQKLCQLDSSEAVLLD